MRHPARTNRVQLDVAHTRQEVPFGVNYRRDFSSARVSGSRRYQPLPEMDMHKRTKT